MPAVPGVANALIRALEKSRRHFVLPNFFICMKTLFCSTLTSIVAIGINAFFRYENISTQLHSSIHISRKLKSLGRNPADCYQGRPSLALRASVACGRRDDGLVVNCGLRRPSGPKTKAAPRRSTLTPKARLSACR